MDRQLRLVLKYWPPRSRVVGRGSQEEIIARFFHLLQYLVRLLRLGANPWALPPPNGTCGPTAAAERLTAPALAWQTEVGGAARWGEGGMERR